MSPADMKQHTLPGLEPSVQAALSPPAEVPMEPGPGTTTYVIDAHSLIFQVFHAIAEMTSPRGEPVAAVYGFLRDVLFLLETHKPHFLLAAFDSHGPTFRHDLYEAYKGERKEMPPELATQIPKIYEVLEGMAVPTLALPGFEADDILATVARLCDERGGECRLVTGDKDCRQLITERVSVYNIRKNQLYGPTELEVEWGIRPDQVVDFQALVGDKIDNVPGVPLIGPKIATELLNTFGNLEAVLASADSVKGAKRSQNLREYADSARLSRKLVRLDPYVPVEVDWDAARPGGYDTQELSRLFAEFGFRGLGDRVLGLAGPVPQRPQANVRYEVVTSADRLRELATEMSRAPRLSVDTETTSINPREADLVGLSFAWEPGEAYYVPVRGPAGSICLAPHDALEILRPVLESPAVGKVGQNLKYDIVVLRGAGIELAGLDFDTMLASYLLDSGERSHNLDELAKKYLGHETIKIHELIGKGKQQKRMDEVPFDAIGPYAAEDADVPLRMLPLLEQRLVEEELAELMADLELPLVEVLAEIEFNGVRVDVDRLAQLSQEYGVRLQELEEQIEEMAGHPFNIASPKQLAEVLFQEQGLPVVKRTKTGPSTDASVLEELGVLHPLPAKIIEHRSYAKLKGTYIDALPAMVLGKTGRVHASLNQVVASTGRLSSSDPNLQNIPVRTPEGREIRSAFTAAGPGWKLLSADYSQIELRVLAHFSEDQAMCQAFASDLDIHMMVASQVNGVVLDEVTPAMRRSAKAVNFGIIYGQSPFGLAKALGIPQEEAAQFIVEYFSRYPGVGQFMRDTLAECYRQGYVKTLLGRKRTISGVRPPQAQEPRGDLFSGSSAPMQLNLPERTAVNSVIQGTAADLIKLAMLAIHRRMKEMGCQGKLILQIHDELLFDAPEEELPALKTMIVEEMSRAAQLRVPLKVDLKVGDNWAACEPE